MHNVTSATCFSCQKQCNSATLGKSHMYGCMYVCNVSIKEFVIWHTTAGLLPFEYGTVSSLVSKSFYCMPADHDYDDDCQLPSCHLPQDRSTWPIRYGLHLGPKQWATWRGPSNYHVWPPTAQLSGGDDQRWLGTRFLTGPQDFQSLGESVCFPMFLLYSDKYSKKPLFSTTPIEFIQWTTLPSPSRRWFSLNNYCACNKWFVWLCCNCLCECMLSRKKEDAKKVWLWSTCESVTARYTFLKCCVLVCVLGI